MKNKYCILTVILFVSVLYAPVTFADSIKVEGILYENIYVKSVDGGTQILFPETGEVRDISNAEMDSFSIVYSEPLDRVKIMEAWRNTPLQSKLRKERLANAEKLKRQKQHEEELEKVREQKNLEQGKLDKKIREQQEIKRQAEQEWKKREEIKRKKEEAEHKKEEAERKKEGIEAIVLTVVFVVGAIVAFIIYFLPTLIAAKRKHHYTWVIFAINVFFGMTGFGYVIAFIWAVWPKKTAIVDLVINDPTSNSAAAGQEIYRKAGANVRAYREARDVQATPPPTDISFRDNTVRLYIHVGDQVKGPYTAEQIDNLVKKGNLTVNSSVCQEGTENWIQLSSLLK